MRRVRDWAPLAPLVLAHAYVRFSVVATKLLIWEGKGRHDDHVHSLIPAKKEGIDAGRRVVLLLGFHRARRGTGVVDERV